MKNLFRIIILATLSFGVSIANAQKVDVDKDQKGTSNLKKAGQVFSMVIEPQDNDLKIYLAGKKTATVDVNAATLEAYLGKDRKKLKVLKQRDTIAKRDYYLIQGLNPKDRDLKIDVKSGDHSETFTIPTLR